MKIQISKDADKETIRQALKNRKTKKITLDELIELFALLAAKMGIK